MSFRKRGIRELSGTVRMTGVIRSQAVLTSTGSKQETLLSRKKMLMLG